MKKWLFRCAKYTSIFLVAFFFVLLVVVFGTGDGGCTQSTIESIEKRAFEQKSTWTDKVLLQGLYQGMVYVGYWKYPNASRFLHHYCQNEGDTLFFKADFLLQNAEVQTALQNNKNAIVFRPTHRTWESLHVSKYTHWDLFYTFDLLFIKRVGKKVIFQDHYFFRPLHKRSYTPFKVGKIRFSLNDGLIHVAYPRAKSYISYGEVDFSKTRLSADQK
jgi:hypothetical protein